MERVEIELVYVMNLLSLIEELLIEETCLEGIVESVRDFNVYTGVLRKDKHVVWGHEGPEKGDPNKKLIKKFDLINKANLNS